MGIEKIETDFVEFVEHESLTGIGSDDNGEWSVSGVCDLYRSHNAMLLQEFHTWINTLLSLL